jgi:hypothetical protein
MEEQEAKLYENLDKWLKLMSPVLSPFRKYTWSGQTRDHIWEILRRGIIVRQHEALSSLVEMCRANFGHFGVTFLRPAFEELVWIEYVYMHSEVAVELIGLIVSHEIADSLNAQNDYMGARAMMEGGFTQRFVKVRTAQDRTGQARLREFGRKLGWSDRALLPSIQFLSKKVKREKDYTFLYHATSRFVHFSTAEILRRVWGQQGSVSVGSASFSDYWEKFAVSWGFRVFVDLLIACEDLLPDAGIPDSDEFMDLFRGFLKVPIITMDELRGWPEAPRA